MVNRMKRLFKGTHTRGRSLGLGADSQHLDTGRFSSAPAKDRKRVRSGYILRACVALRNPVLLAHLFRAHSRLNGLRFHAAAESSRVLADQRAAEQPSNFGGNCLINYLK